MDEKEYELLSECIEMALKEGLRCIGEEKINEAMYWFGVSKGLDEFGYLCSTQNQVR